MRPRRLVPAVLGSAGLAALGVYGAQAAQFRKQAGKPFDLSPAAAPGTPEFTRWVEAACAAPLREGNRVQVLNSGPQILSSMLDAIAEATETVDLATYIFWKGQTPTSFAEALAARARAGVEVNVLLDGWGSAPADKELVTTSGAGRSHGGLVPTSSLVQPPPVQQPHAPPDPRDRRQARLHRCRRHRR